jgi:hypothetical protein
MSNVDALGMHCSALESVSDKTFTTALASWQKRNLPYVNAALSYVADIEDYMLARQGEEARQKFHDDRKAGLVKATHTTEAVWFPTREIDKKSCLNMARHAADGSMDLDQNTEFFPTLQAMKAELESASR